MAKKKKMVVRKKTAVAKKAQPTLTLKKKPINPQVALHLAIANLSKAKIALMQAAVVAKGNKSGGCMGSCDGYGEGVGFDWVHGECVSAVQHQFSQQAWDQAQNDLMQQANASCRIGGGSDCKCTGGKVIESRREQSQVGEWGQYVLFLKLDGGTCH